VLPVICMITDVARSGDATVDRIAAAARAGVALVQIREPRLDGGALFNLVRQAIRAVTGTSTRIVVNDRLDVALCAGAHGVHLRADSMPAARVRAVSPPGFLVGRSVHDVEHTVGATAGGGLDYLVFGTVFPTTSKPGRKAAGVQALTDVAAATTLPVLAVGGVEVESMTRLAAAGAAGFAAISLFADVSLGSLPDMVGESSATFHAAGRSI
jgi:thiamine-phosphate diphosphorylase